MKHQPTPQKMPPCSYTIVVKQRGHRVPWELEVGSLEEGNSKSLPLVFQKSSSHAFKPELFGAPKGFLRRCLAYSQGIWKTRVRIVLPGNFPRTGWCNQRNRRKWKSWKFWWAKIQWTVLLLIWPGSCKKKQHFRYTWSIDWKHGDFLLFPAKDASVNQGPLANVLHSHVSLSLLEELGALLVNSLIYSNN